MFKRVIAILRPSYRYRSAETGEFISKVEFDKRDKTTTVRERV